MNLENLKIGVEGVKKMIAENKFPIKEFSIESFGGVERLDEASLNYTINNYKKGVTPECGTSACFLGLFPFVEGLKPVKNDYISFDESNTDVKGFSYLLYAQRLLCDPDESYDEYLKEWRYVFSDEWHRYQPSLEEAISRAEDILNGNYDENWEFQ